MNKKWKNILAPLMAGFLCVTFATYAGPKDKSVKGANQGETVSKASPEPSKAPMVTARFKDRGIRLASGYRGVRQGANTVAVYRNNVSTGVTMTCICTEGGYCELKYPDGADYFSCDPHGCPHCEMLVKQPKGAAAAIFQAVRIKATATKAQ